MSRTISIFSFFLFLILFSSCYKETVDYNQKANEVIQQLILDESCGCILEIPKESIIEMNSILYPQRDTRKQLMEKLHLRDRKELDSIEILSKNFILDSVFLKQNHIIVVPLDSLKVLANNPNFCTKGILCIRKPWFNKEYKKAVVDYGHAYICSSYAWANYEFENGKWKLQKPR
ncbi:MAG: hypothetical protein V4548_00485 [Bacteroidota bacterium]